MQSFILDDIVIPFSLIIYIAVTSHPPFECMVAMPSTQPNQQQWLNRTNPSPRNTQNPKLLYPLTNFPSMETSFMLSPTLFWSTQKSTSIMQDILNIPMFNPDFKKKSVSCLFQIWRNDIKIIQHYFSLCFSGYQ